MLPHPLCHFLITLRCQIARISSTKIPLKSNFFPPFCRVITAIGSPISSNHSKTTINLPPLLFSVKHLCSSSSSQWNSCNSPKDVCENATVSASDKVYETIVSNYSSNQSLETYLDALRLELTTEIVNDVIHRLRYEEKLAFMFFTWAGHQDGYTHDHQSFNDMIDILTSTRVRDPNKAMKVLEEMLERGHDPESFTYNAAITSFCGVGMIKEGRELFEFMRTKGSTISSPTAKTYSVMIIALAKYDMMDECFNLLNDMRSCGCLPDVSTYIDLIEGMCLAEKIDAAYKILEEMGEKGYPPDILTYNCFLKVLCSMRKHEEALRLCEKMIEGGCEPSVHTYNMLITLFFEIGDSNRAFGIWHEMDERGCSRSVDSYGIMIDGLFGCGRVEEACFFLEEVIDRGIKLSYKKFDVLMSRLSEIGNLHAIHRLSEHMRRFYNVAMARRFAMSQKKKSMSLRRP